MTRHHPRQRVGQLSADASNQLGTREQQALLRLNTYAWYASGRTRWPRFREMVAAIKAIKFLAATDERRQKYFDGVPGYSAHVEDFRGLFRLKTTNTSADELDPARFVSGARLGAMMIERRLVEEAVLGSR